MRAKDVMKRQVVFVEVDDVLEKVVSVLMQNHVSGVPVVDKNNQLVGIVTEKDLMTKKMGLNISSYMEFVTSILLVDGKKLLAVSQENVLAMTAGDIMSTPVYSVRQEATIEEIVSLMMNRHINRIPVIDQKNKLVGIIGRNDLLPILMSF